MAITYQVDGKTVSQDEYNRTLDARRRGASQVGSGVYNPSGSNFNLNPSPQSGMGPFGAVPGPLGLPNPAGDLTKQLPNLPALNTAASAQILAKLNGQLSPGTLNALKNASAEWGVKNGMPGSGITSNHYLGNVAGASEAQALQGLQAYQGFVPTVSGTQTVRPELQNEIATQNSVNAAAPDPTQSASYAQQLFNSYLSQMRGPGGGTRNAPSPAGGTSPAIASERPLGPTNYFNPRSVAPTGPPMYGGQPFTGLGSAEASSYNPQTWADWESEMYDFPAPDVFGATDFGSAPDYAPQMSDLYWE